MFANVFTKTIRDRVGGGLLGSVVVAAMILFSLWVYGDVDTSFYYELPVGILELMGIDPDGSGVGAMAFGSMYNFIAAFVVAGIAISIGAASIAGEEQEGTFGFLLGNPVSRHGVLVSKAASLTLIVALMGLILWAGALWSADITDTDLTGLHIGAVTIALSLNGLFYGFLAMAIGAWTGNRGMASGASVGLMVVGYLAAGLLPLADLEGVARVFPWYYYSSSAPLNNGLDTGHTLVLIALSVVSFAVAWVGIQRRDLKEKSLGVTLVDRLRENPRTQKVMDRLAGSTRVSRISVKSASDFQVLLTVTAGIMFYMGVLIPPLFNFIPEDFVNVFATFPDAMVAMIGGVDMGTATGFVTGEIFSLVGPVAVIVLLATMGGRALAGEEEEHTMGLLLSNPVSRSQVLFEKVTAMIFYAVAFAATVAIATWMGVLLAGLDEVTIGGIASVSVLLALFGLVYGGVSLLVSAATGRTRLANMTTAGVAVLTWFMFSFLTLSETTEPLANLSPFQWYLGGDPLLNGMDWTGAALLGGTFVALVVVSIPLFQRRDLRG